jgi:hypothetical protein
MKYKLNLIPLKILGILFILITISCQNKISTRFLHFNEGYQDYKLDFLEDKPEVEILFLKKGIGQRGRLGVLSNNFNRILSRFISKKQLNSYPGEFIFLIDGILNKKNEISYNDIKAITTIHHVNDTSNRYRLFIKDNKSGQFIEYTEENNENDVFTGLNSRFKMPSLKDSHYSYLIVYDMDKRNFDYEPSPKNCVPPGSRYIKMDFEYLPDLKGLNVLCYNADSIQRCEMNLGKKHFMEGLNNLLTENHFDIFPSRYIIFLPEHVEKKEMIRTEEIKAISTITSKDSHYFHRFFLKNGLNYFEDVPEMRHIYDSTNFNHYDLIAKHLIPELSNSKCSYILIYDFEAEHPRTVKPINEFIEKYNEYIKDIQIKKSQLDN